jgi:hypothetical protein
LDLRPVQKLAVKTPGYGCPRHRLAALNRCRERPYGLVTGAAGNLLSGCLLDEVPETVKPIIAEVLSFDSHLRTDESGIYWKIGEGFASHRTVNHSANEYVRGDAHTNTVEGYISILKRGTYGVYHHVS